MLGIVTYVFGHQGSISLLSFTWNVKNGWFKIDLGIFQKKLMLFLSKDDLKLI